MLRGTRQAGGSDLAGGLVTLPNFFNLDANQSPNCMNVVFNPGGSIEKRLGSSSTNTTLLASTAGWGAFDFGAGGDLRWLVVAAGSGIYASSNRGKTFVSIHTGNFTVQDYINFERSKAFLIATMDSTNQVVYWAGSVNSFMLSLAVGSAPAARHAIDFQGFLMLMNTNANKRRIAYADNNLITTDPWNNTFDLPSSFDDEITGASILNKRLYVFTKYKIFRISYVGGNPDFAYQDVKDWGAVPRTIKKITMPEVGEVIICLSWDKTIRIFDGSEDQILSGNIEDSGGIADVSLEDLNDNAFDVCFAETDTNQQTYKLWFGTGTSKVSTHCFVFDPANNAFYPFDNQIFHSAVMAESGGTAARRELMGIRRTGQVHIINSGNTDVGTAIKDYYQSPIFFGKTPGVASKSQRIALYFSATSSGNVYFEDRVNFQATFQPPRAVISFADTANKIQITKTIDLPITQNTYQFQLSSSSSTADPWRLNRADIDISDLGIGKA